MTLVRISTRNAIDRVLKMRGRSKKKLVVVLGTLFRVDQRQMSSTIMHDPHFADYCWHINRAFALCRMYTNTETPCEQWVGSLKNLCNTIQGTTTATLTRRLRARCAAVTGAEVDRKFLEKLACSVRKKPQGHTARIASPAVATFEEKAELQAQKEARPLLQASVLRTETASTSIKIAERESVAEGRVMEDNDLALAQRVKRPSGVAKLPFAAKTRDAWEKAIGMPSFYAIRTARAKAYAQANEKPRLPIPKSPSASSLSSSSSSSSSLSSSMVSAPAETPVASEAAACVVAFPDAAEYVRYPWVTPDGRSLHGRVDHPGGKYSTLCKPWHTGAKIFAMGDDKQSAIDTGIGWCRRCAKALA